MLLLPEAWISATRRRRLVALLSSGTLHKHTLDDLEIPAQTWGKATARWQWLASELQASLRELQERVEFGVRGLPSWQVPMREQAPLKRAQSGQVPENGYLTMKIFRSKLGTAMSGNGRDSHSTSFHTCNRTVTPW